jgi:hypothetical protein
MRYVRGDGVRLHGYSESDWVASAVDRKRDFGGCFILGSIVVSLYNRTQNSMELNSTEEEYMEASLASCEDIWLLKILAGLFS